ERLNAGELSWEQAADAIRGAVVQSLGDGIRETDLAPQLREAVAGLAEGQVARPVPMADRLLVVQVAERTTGSSVRGFEEAAPELRNQLYEQKLDEGIEEWYQQARRRAAVRILLDQ